MSPGPRVCAAVFIAVLCVACASARSGEALVELRATTGERETTTGPKRVLILTVSNHSARQVVVAKPALPSSWVIDKSAVVDGAPHTEQLRGAVGRGQPEPGKRTRYRAEQYARIEPGASFSYVTDLDFYLSGGSTQPPPGRYVAVFRYEYSGTPDEDDLPLVSGANDSNQVVVEIPN